jgi:hypothetical protein
MFLAACSGPVSTEPAGEAQSAIVNGQVSDATDDAVVNLTIVGAQGCTATMIAPNVVLTALHCVTHYVSENFSCKPDGTLVASTPTGGSLGATVNPGSIEIRYGVDLAREPDAYGMKVFGTGTINVCSNDFAAVVLDRDLDLPFVAVRFGRNVTRGEFVRAVGYGQTEMPTSSGRKVRTGLQVIDVGSNDTMPGSKTAAPRTFVVGEGPCHGDSGGPALSEETGAIIGVYSLIAGATCTTVAVRNIFTQLPPFESIVREALEFAGREPVIEGMEPGTSEGGNGGGGESSTGGSPGTAGDSSEGGAVARGGTSSTGGRGSGGNANGGSSNGGVTGGSTAQAATGNEPDESTEGSGSRRDGSCACTVIGAQQRAAAPVGALLLSLGFAARRRWRRPARKR